MKRQYGPLRLSLRPSRTASLLQVLRRVGLLVAAAAAVAVAATAVAWAAARPAVAPGYPVPDFGVPVGAALLRALTTASLDPLIGPDGSRLAFWPLLAVFTTLIVLPARWLASHAGATIRTHTARGRYTTRDAGLRPHWREAPPSMGLLASADLPTPSWLDSRDTDPTEAARQQRLSPHPYTPPPDRTHPARSTPLNHPRAHPDTSGSTTSPLGPTTPPATTPPHSPTPHQDNQPTAPTPPAPGTSNQHLDTDRSPDAPPARAQSSDQPPGNGEPPAPVLTTHAVPVLLGERRTHNSTTGDNTQITIDLAAQRGLGLTGPGAEAAARAVLATLMHPPTTRPHALILITPSHAARLLGATTPPETTPPETALPGNLTMLGETTRDSTQLIAGSTVCLVDTLTTGLDHLEQQVFSRARISQDNLHAVHTPLVLFAEPDISERARLEAILNQAAPFAIAAVLTTAWPTGTTYTLETDGTIINASGPDPLNPSTTRIHTAHRGQLTLRTTAPPTFEPSTTPTSGPTTTDIHTASHIHTESPQDTESSANPAGSESSANPAGSEGVAMDNSTGSTSENTPAPPSTTASASPQPPEDPTDRKPTPALNDTGDAGGTAAPPGAVLLVRCFGGLAVRVTGTCPTPPRHITPPLTEQSALLLSCLATHPAGASADTLIEAAWPDDTSREEAIGRLHTALSLLRRRLRTATGLPGGSFATYVRGRYYLGAHPEDPLVWVDYACFDTALRIARTQTGDTRITALQQATTLYTGPLLVDADPNWIEIDTLREEARKTTITALNHLAEHYERSDSTRATQLLESALEHDPTHQPTATYLISLHKRHHRPDAAHRVYTDLAERLAQLGRTPDPTSTAALRHRPTP